MAIEEKAFSVELHLCIKEYNIADVGREQKLLLSWKQNATHVTKNISLEMNKFTENECLPNFELKFKSLENLRKPLLLKSTRGRIVEKNRMAKTREESQTTVLAEKNKQASRKKIE